VTSADLVLAGDIGGTKTDIAVYTRASGVRAPMARESFPNRDFDGLEAIAREFVGRLGATVVAACFDVAGPVANGIARVTNLPWVVAEESLRSALGIARVQLLNDLEATAIAVPGLQPSELHTLSQGLPVSGGPIAVIAPGTGLGEAFLTSDGTRYRAHASEGGHTDFGPRSRDQIDLLVFLADRFDHVSYELVCSGIGIPNLYSFLLQTGLATELTEVAARIEQAEDRTRVIMEAGLEKDGRSTLCAATLDLFARILGAEAGNLALKVMATGGVFVGGGIPPRMLSVLGDGGFMHAFGDKGRLSRVLMDVPVHVILSPAALMGAAESALQLAEA
jgi:glucokinase